MTTHLMDLDEERLVRHFCLEDECKEVLQWFKDKTGAERPEGAEERLALAADLRRRSNASFEASEFQDAMMYALSALHALDFSQARSAVQTDAQKREALRLLVPVLSNLSMIFLRRGGDGYNAARAADLGLERLRRMDQDAEATKFRAKLLFRRGLAKGQTKDFVDARADLREAAKLMPENREIRRALENCKAAEVQQRGAPDDQWRGLLTETPTTSRWRAKLRRGWRSCGAAFGHTVGKKPWLLLVLGPILTFGMQVLVLQWLQPAASPTGAPPELSAAEGGAAAAEPIAATSEL